MKVEAVVEALEEARIFVAGFADVRDGDDGVPQPNAAMQLLVVIDEALAKVPA